MFYVTISEDFKRFQYFNFETDFVENENLFQKTGELKALRLKRHHFHKMCHIRSQCKTNRMVTTKWTQRTGICQ